MSDDTPMDSLSVQIFKTDASSNKEYHLHLRPEGEGWVVAYRNGKRGSPLTAGGLKTKVPVDYAAARKVYDKTLRSKLSDGYTPDESGSAYAGTDKEGEVTGFQPQLLTATDEDGILERYRAGGWGFQIKHNGERRGVLASNEVVFSSRRGLRVGVRVPIQEAITALHANVPRGFEIDGEDMGDTLIIFDVLAWDGTDLRAKPFSERAEALEEVQAVLNALRLTDALKTSPVFTFTSEEDARAQMQAMRLRKEEGIVGKQMDAPAKAGRPTRNGPAVKYKFWESATVRVAPDSRVKRSVGIEVLDTDTNTWVGIGNCTIPTNADIPQAGELIEVIYLYAFKGGALHQPQFDRPRPDMTQADARLDALKFYEPVLADA